MDQVTPKPTEDEPQKQIFTKIDHARFFIASYLIILVVAALLGGIYAWQHNHVKAATASIDNLNGVIQTNSNRLEDLSRELTDQNTEIGNLERKLNPRTSAANSAQNTNQVTASIIIQRAAILAPCNCGHTTVIVSILFKNITANPLTLRTTDFLLQDTQAMNYTAQPGDRLQQQSLPKGYGPMSDQIVTANQSVNGSLLFILPRESRTTYTLIYGSQTYTVSTL